jgi:hypothetical protein
MEGPDNSNHELISYYVDVARNPKEAMLVAELEIGRRQDVYTLSAHAWALCAAGRFKEADVQMKRALQVGVKDPETLERARVIASRLASADSKVKRPSASVR